MSGSSSERMDQAGWLPDEIVAELGELLVVAEAVEPVVAALAARYHRLGCWDHAWPADPVEPGAVDPRVLVASGDDRLRALLGGSMPRSRVPIATSTRSADTG